MTTVLEFEWDSRDLAFWRGGKPELALARAVKKAGGDAIRAIQVASKRSVRFRKRLPLRRVNSAMPMEFPAGKALESLEWRMRVSGEPVPLADYPYAKAGRRATKTIRINGRLFRGGGGINVGVNKGRRVLVKGAFVGTMRSGHVGIFRRTGKARLPIEELFSTRVSDVFRDSGMVPAIYLRGSAVFNATFQRLMPLELARVSGG